MHVLGASAAKVPVGPGRLAPWTLGPLGWVSLDHRTSINFKTDLLLRTPLISFDALSRGKSLSSHIWSSNKQRGLGSSYSGEELFLLL